MPSARSSTRYLWRAHAALLVLVGGYIGWSALITTPDANIGLSLGLLALSAMGAPWTLPLFSNEQFTVDSGPFVVVAAGGAILNLVLHAVVLSRWSARAVRRH